MATPFKLKRSSIPGKRPQISDLELGELGYNFNDGKLYSRKENVGIGSTVTLLNVWTENLDRNIYYSIGNVGIGTTNPSVTLDVNGTINLNTSGESILFSAKNPSGRTGNLFIGGGGQNITAGANPWNGSNNIGIGKGSLLDITSGSGNVAIGQGILPNLTTGLDNIAIGSGNGSNLNGSDNIIIGNQLLGSSNNSIKNILIGRECLKQSTTGNSNIVLGFRAAFSVSGNNNVAIGEESLLLSTTGSENIAFGVNSLYSNISGSNNISIGGYSGTTTNRSRKILIGWGNGSNRFDAPKNADNQLAIGQRTGGGAASYWIVGNELYNIGIGTTNPTAKLDVNGTVNVAGLSTFASDLDINASVDISNDLNVSGVSTFLSDLDINASVDISSDLNVSGIATFQNNIRVNGITVGVSTRSSTNIAIGDNALLVDSTGVTNNNIAIGQNALSNNIGPVGRANIAIGGDALKNNSAENNTAIGYRCLENNQGYHNLAIGFWTLRDTTTGQQNTAVGGNSNYQNTSGGQNSSLGHNSLNQNISGSYNVALGKDSLLSNTTGNYNVGLGVYVGVTTNRSRKILIGSGNGSNRFDSPNTTSDTQLAIGQRTGGGAASYWIVGNENYDVGIGTTNPRTKLDVVGGNISVGIDTSHGLILTSPNGTKYRLIVADDGTLTTVLD